MMSPPETESGMLTEEGSSQNTVQISRNFLYSSILHAHAELGGGDAEGRHQRRHLGLLGAAAAAARVGRGHRDLYYLK